MNRRKLLAGFGALGIFGAHSARAEGEDMPQRPADADFQAFEERLNYIQHQIDYKTVGNNPFVRSNDFAYGTVLDRQTSEVNATNTVSEVTLWSFQTPPNTLGRERLMRLSVRGDCFNNTATDPQNIDLKLTLSAAGTTSSTTQAARLRSSARRARWDWEILIAAAASTGAQLSFWRALTNSIAPVAGQEFRNGFIEPHGLISFATTLDGLQPLTIALTATWGAADANLEWKRQFVSLELI
jgi:hypothetical protein